MAPRLQKKISQLYAEIGKKPVPSWKKHLILEVVTSDADDEDVEVPFIVVHL